MLKNDKKLDRADIISAWRLCMGCGACKWACPNDAITLKNIVNHGIRPFVDESKCEKCGKCAEICPGLSLEHEEFSNETLKALQQGWGPILDLHEAYATDDSIRFAGSSGGVATAMSLYAIEEAGFSGVLHTKADPDDPICNISTLSTNREELLQTTGSRYAPAAPCQAFDLLKTVDGPCMFVGKPCDCAALRKACKIDNDLKEKVALVVSIFCAGTPTTAGTLAMLNSMGVSDPDQIKSLRYRGNGWPGMTTVEFANAAGKPANSFSMTYDDAWGGILSKHGQLRCRLCPDSTGEFADISCGDPWYRETEGDPGRSLILLRTKKGADFYEHGCLSNYIKSEKAEPDTLPASQKSVFQRRCQIHARLKAIRMFNIPAPNYTGFDLKNNWKSNSFKVKWKTYLSTIKRCLFRNWRKQQTYDGQTTRKLGLPDG